MNHPIILACLKLRRGFFHVKDVIALCDYSHSTIRHRLEGLAAVGILTRKVEKNHLVFHVQDLDRLCAIRDGHEPLPHSAEVPALQQQDCTLSLARLLGYLPERLVARKGKIHDIENSHNPDAKSRAGTIHRFSSLEIV